MDMILLKTLSAEFAQIIKMVQLPPSSIAQCK